MSQSVRRAADASPVVPRIGTAGWGIPRDDDAAFPAGGSRLERYAARLRCVEINSSFYRSHRRSTYERWAHTVPEEFRFAVKSRRRSRTRSGSSIATMRSSAFSTRAAAWVPNSACCWCSCHPVSPTMRHGPARSSTRRVAARRWPGLVYLRLHGSPRTYASPYDDARLDEVAARLRHMSVPAWCIFDNTKFGAATGNALAVDAAIRTPH